MATSTGDEDNDIQEEGGYWLGTERAQNSALMSSLSASARRSSVFELTATHPQAIQDMQQRFPEAHAHDLIRFLQARDFHVEKAAQMYSKHLQWRQANLPISYDSVKETLSTRKFYLLDDTDNVGHAVIFYCLRRFKEAPYNIDDEINALLYLLENDVKQKSGNSLETQQWTVLIDVSGIKSPPLAFLRQVNAIMEANYPERLFLTVMFPVPKWLQRIIATFLVFVDEDTRNKFAYVNDIKSLEEFAMMPMEKMGSDVAGLANKKQL